ncbi:MAG TPA: ABC transporter ATP-binding protein [Anaerolineales bacterium]|jgi:branched-chain amino acid transport system ATP-binding protein|nr:ABC transporter ATP-binding protein [Anaerolineales bacterium]
MNQLQVSGLTKRFGGLTANLNIDVTVGDGEIVGLIGPNGAGKTTLFNCVAGIYRPEAGRVVFEGRDVTGWPPEKICRAGVARTFQIVKSFGQMTVLENVMVGAFLHNARSAAARATAMEVLEFTGLAEKQGMLARNLTIADKKRLELTRALATGPKFMMLDEAMAGLTPKETQEAVELIQALHDRGITILLVEHVMEVVMPISDRIVVLEYGQKIAEGEPAQIARDERVIKAYLGVEYRASS